MPFTAAQFFDVFRQYNEAVWPVQLLLLAAALVAAVIAIRARPHAGRTVSAVLAILWLWMGVVYHMGFFRAINRAATLFGPFSSCRAPSSRGSAHGLPCPTTIFTLGLLLWARPPVPRALVVVPAIWAVVGAVGALQLNVAEDFGLLLAGAITTPMILLRRRHANVVRMA